MIKLFIISLLIFTEVSCAPSAAVKKPILKSDSYYSYATWYGPGFHGRQAADGSTYDQNLLTCAHPSFPFGTHIEVMNIANGKKIVVKVTDRSGHDVLDLTEKAFSSIAAKSEGRIKVRIKPVETSEINSKTQAESIKNTDSAGKNEKEISHSSGAAENCFYAIQFAAFKSMDAAKSYMDSARIPGSYIYFEQGTVDIYRVRVGKFSSENEALKYKSSNFGKMESIVVKVRD